jgi:hypothetical protein
MSFIGLSGLGEGVHSFTQRLEEVGGMEKAFGMPGKHQAVRLQQRGKTGEYFVLGWLVEIDHHVTAENNVERPTHRPIGFQQIDPLELDQALSTPAVPKQNLPDFPSL